MNKKFLKLKPTRFLCPFCGEWHHWTHGCLEEYDRVGINVNAMVRNVCSSKKMTFFNTGMYDIYFKNGYLCYRITIDCIGRDSFDKEIEGQIAVDSIIENGKKPIAMFKIKIGLQQSIGKSCCCSSAPICYFSKLYAEQKLAEIEMELGFEFEISEYKEISKVFKYETKRRALKKARKALKNKEEYLNILEKELQEKEKSLQEKEKALNLREEDYKNKISENR